MLKRDEIDNPESTWNKITMDEPVFILRAQDETAPETIKEWLQKNWNTLSSERRYEVETAIMNMAEWPHRRKPD